MRIDLHVHTCYSPDSRTSLDAVARWMARRQLDAVAITDHNAIAGALALQRRLPGAVIVGEEIQTTHGEIIGLFLQEAIAPGLPPREAVARIRAQGGLVYLPHPFDSLRGFDPAGSGPQGILDLVDIVEVLNARVHQPASNRRAAELAVMARRAAGAGSDAHLGWEIGRVWVELPPFEGPAGLLRALAQARVGGHSAPHWVHLGSRGAYLLNRLRRRHASSSEEPANPCR